MSLGYGGLSKEGGLSCKLKCDPVLPPEPECYEYQNDPDLKFWYDFSDLSTLTLSPFGSISGVADKSGNNLFLEQRFFFFQPEFYIDTGTSTGWGQFDNSFLDYTGPAQSFNHSYCYFIVLKMDNVTPNQVIADTLDDPTNQLIKYFDLVGPTDEIKLNGMTISESDTGELTTPIILTFNDTPGGGGPVVYANGVPYITAGFTPQIFDNWRVGSGYTGGIGFTGLIGEFFMINRSLTTEEIECTVEQLESKFSIGIGGT